MIGGLFLRALDRGRRHPAGDDRRGHRRRARRRVRARPGVRLPRRVGAGPARPARDPARHHPGRRRHPAPAPPGRAGPGQGPHLHRPPGRRRRGARHRPGRRGRPAGRGARPGASPRPPSWPRAPSSPTGWPSGRSTGAWTSPWTAASTSSRSSSSRSSAPRTPRTGVAVVPARRPGQGRLLGAVAAAAQLARCSSARSARASISAWTAAPGQLEAGPEQLQLDDAVVQLVGRQGIRVGLQEVLHEVAGARS